MSRTASQALFHGGGNGHRPSHGWRRGTAGARLEGGARLVQLPGTTTIERQKRLQTDSDLQVTAPRRTTGTPRTACKQLGTILVFGKHSRTQTSSNLNTRLEIQLSVHNTFRHKALPCTSTPNFTSRRHTAHAAWPMRAKHTGPSDLQHFARNSRPLGVTGNVTRA